MRRRIENLREFWGIADDAPAPPKDLPAWLEAQMPKNPEPPNVRTERDHFDRDYWNPYKSKARGADRGLFGGDY